MTLTEQVLKHFDSHVRLNVYVDDIAADTGLTTQQVRSAISTLRLRNAVNIEKVAANCWRYDPSKPPVEVGKKISKSEKLFELIGQSKTGKFILQDEDGELFLAEQL